MLVMPEDSLEQRLNARIVAQWRIGMQTSPGRLPGELLQEFLSRHDELAANVRTHQRDGLAEALAAIHEAVAELANGTGRSNQAVGEQPPVAPV